MRRGGHVLAGNGIHSQMCLLNGSQPSQHATSIFLRICYYFPLLVFRGNFSLQDTCFFWLAKGSPWTPRIGVPLLYFMLNGQGTAKAAGESTSSAGRKWSNWRHSHGASAPKSSEQQAWDPKKQEKDMVGGDGFSPCAWFSRQKSKVAVV